ncbi:MAG: tetratricopeptide repeat protein [Gemmatimonadaceae bacterium]
MTGRRMTDVARRAGVRRAALALAVLSLVTAAVPLGAQRAGPRQETRARQVRAARESDRRARVIRAEAAAVLLESGRYREAAREYRVLLASEPRRADYRLALARALAWGGEAREAERELREVRVLRPNDPAVSALLLSVRESYEPSAAEAAGWLAELPGHAPYRLALARALVRAANPRAALGHYDRLLATGRPIATRPPLSVAALLREAAEARVAAGDPTVGARMLADALARAPNDSAVRHGLAQALAGGRRYREALAQYDTLIAGTGGPIAGLSATTAATLAPRAPSAPPPAARAVLLLERAQIHVARGDFGAAGADASASLAAAPTAGAYVLQGDLGRWRGQYALARASYERARVLQPQSRAVAVGFARLAREERPALAFTSLDGGEDGWRTRTDVVADNLGVRYGTAGVQRRLDLRGGVLAGVGAEYRQLSERSALRSVDVRGYAAEVAASRDANAGAFYGRAGARGGLVAHPGVGAAPEGQFSVGAWYGPWGVGLDLSSALAYPSLLTIASLRPAIVDGTSEVPDRPLRENATSVALAGPAGRADLALVGQRSRFSDGNVRSTAQLYARFPLVPRLSTVYAASSVRFAERSALYWDPIAYVTHAAGLEYAARPARGLAYALQVLPSVAWSREIVRRSTELPPSLDYLDPGDQLRRRALQVTSAGELAYRSSAWETVAALTYGRGRAGDYQRLGATVRVRVTP